MLDTAILYHGAMTTLTRILVLLVHVQQRLWRRIVRSGAVESPPGCRRIPDFVSCVGLQRALVRLDAALKEAAYVRSMGNTDVMSGQTQHLG